jgi:hypothetical protein
MALMEMTMVMKMTMKITIKTMMRTTTMTMLDTMAMMTMMIILMVETTAPAKKIWIITFGDELIADTWLQPLVLHFGVGWHCRLLMLFVMKNIILVQSFL